MRHRDIEYANEALLQKMVKIVNVSISIANWLEDFKIVFSNYIEEKLIHEPCDNQSFGEVLTSAVDAGEYSG